eukprot:scaffold87919_cov15-Tisochrysis_lutea.AAC.1
MRLLDVWTCGHLDTFTRHLSMLGVAGWKRGERRSCSSACALFRWRAFGGYRCCGAVNNSTMVLTIRKKREGARVHLGFLPTLDNPSLQEYYQLMPAPQVESLKNAAAYRFHGQISAGARCDAIDSSSQTSHCLDVSKSLSMPAASHQVRLQDVS